jgi:hypothetical protein
MKQQYNSLNRCAFFPQVSPRAPGECVSLPTVSLSFLNDYFTCVFLQAVSFSKQLLFPHKNARTARRYIPFAQKYLSSAHVTASFKQKEDISTIRNIIRALRNVILAMRSVILAMRNVILALRSVILAMRNVILILRNVILALRNVIYPKIRIQLNRLFLSTTTNSFIHS